MKFLETLGRFVQQSLSTNTAQVMAVDVRNIYYNYKRGRSIWCLSLAVAAGAGGVALFVAEPTTLSYFQPIVHQALPFIGSIGAKIAVGTIGFWLGGAFGHNAGKYTAQQFSQKRYGHPNTAFAFDDNDVGRIVDNNPQHYPKTDLEQGLSEEEKALREQNIAELKALLLHVRDKIDSHSKKNPAAHEAYKYALLSALRTSNLSPLLDLLAGNMAKRSVRANWTAQLAHHIGNVPEGFLDLHQRDSSMLIEDGDESEKVSRDLSEEDNAIIALKNTPVHVHMKRQVKMLNDVKHYSVKQGTANNGRKLLNNSQKRELLTQLKQTHIHQQQKQTAELDLVPNSFKRLLRI
ncbi:MAG: hypothetical protein BGO43_09615 [Gammaproteobacteria bacterium 39-13]|nr:hypothetical protein [Gammaproteobacteria bacterium]OJV93897.1 MAG: hypothetical protein BGO43_09615 [Gammaproteobacteria bacterium 39-13]